jgi:hypothetical protein
MVRQVDHGISTGEQRPDPRIRAVEHVLNLRARHLVAIAVGRPHIHEAEIVPLAEGRQHLRRYISSSAGHQDRRAGAI